MCPARKPVIAVVEVITMTELHRDWQWYILLALSAAGTIGGICGVDEGWAYAEKHINGKSHWGPSFELHLSLGWWNSTSDLSSSWVPGKFQVRHALL